MLSKVTIKYTLILLLGIMAFSAKAQTYFEGRVIDASNGDRLPFATVLNYKGYGTTTDLEGYFSILVKPGDSLRVSYIGFNVKIIKIPANFSGIQEVKLNPQSTEIATVTISAKSDFLYNLVARSRFSIAQSEKQARSYLSLETKVNQRTIERMEAYYNAKIAAYDLKQLDLKGGRIGVQSFMDRYFVSLNSSRALLMQKLMEESEYFPLGPLGMSKGKLKRNFKLSFASRYKDEAGRKVYQIDFAPTEKKPLGFEGTVWLDSARAAVIKIEYQKNKTNQHPFIPLFPDGEISSANLFIRKEFQRIKDDYFLKSLDFNYQLQYLNGKEELFLVETQALLRMYDFESLFFLPKFNFPAESFNDYRKINAIPYQKDFWENPERFQLNDEYGSRSAFFNNPATVRSHNTKFGDQDKIGFFEHPYSRWNGKRILMRENAGASTRNYSGFLADQYHLEVQLFMDVHELGDTLQYETASIFDPYQSYYNLPQDSVSAVFINLYHDLGEVYRRKLDKALSKAKTLKDFESIYQRISKEFKSAGDDYFKEVELGRNRKALRAWNDDLKEATGIDNIALFWKE